MSINSDLSPSFEITHRGYRNSIQRAADDIGSYTISEQFALKHLPLIFYIMHSVGWNDPNSPTYWDLLSQGLLGLLIAKEKFDPSREVQFSTFASAHIRGRIRDFLRKSDWLPRKVRHAYRDIQDSRWILTQQLHRTPTENEIASHLGQDLVKVRELIAQGTVELSSLNSCLDQTEDGVNIYEAIADENQMDPADIVCDRALVKDLHTALNQLPEQERRVLCQYYFEKKSQKEIGASLGISKSRVSQIRRKGEFGLRNHMKASLLTEF